MDKKDNVIIKLNNNQKESYFGDIVIGLFSLILIVSTIFIFFKFKNPVVEIDENITVKTFERFPILSKYAKINTPIKDIVVSKLGSQKVSLSFLGINYDVNLKVVDTTPPVINVREYSSKLGYVIKKEDFYYSIDDKQDVKVSYETKADTSKFGTYDVTIKAVDKSGNETVAKTKLNISWAALTYDLEYGEKLSKSDLIYDMEKDSGTILDSDIEKINSSEIGNVKIKTTRDGETKDIIVSIKDTLGPTIVADNKSIYYGHKDVTIDSFLKGVDDASKVKSVELVGDIDYELIGDQTLKVVAYDEYNNKSEKEVVLNIKLDKEGPIINGLSTITITRGQAINFTAGVSAWDENDGECEFTYNASSVNQGAYGTYALYYSATDKAGNTTTAKRIVIINHSPQDTNNRIMSIANSLSNNVEAIRDYVRNNVSYNSNWGGNDPIWYGLTMHTGNCYVHATIFDALLKQKGYTTKIIWVTDKSHYWNLVYLGDRWVHMDSTPTSRHNKISIMNDDQRYANLQGRNWDRNAWPKAL